MLTVLLCQTPPFRPRGLKGAEALQTEHSQQALSGDTQPGPPQAGQGAGDAPGNPGGPAAWWILFGGHPLKLERYRED